MAPPLGVQLGAAHQNSGRRASGIFRAMPQTASRESISGSLRRLLARAGIARRYLAHLIMAGERARRSIALSPTWSDLS